MTASEFSRRLDEHRSHLWGLCYRVTGNAADADDLVQDTFRRALERPPADLERPLRPWLATVATRLCIDALRRRQTRRYVGPWLPSAVETPRGTTLGELASGEVDVETRYGLLESVSFAFLLAVEALTPVQRAVLVLRDVLGYTGPEAADVLAITPSNARVTLHRARAAMAAYDERRRVPTESEQAAQQVALQRLMVALSAGDAEAIARCLAEDVRVATDGGGRYRAATKVVTGRERAAAFFVGLRKHSGMPTHVEPRTINGWPAVVICSTVTDPRDAPRACIAIDLDSAGLVTDFHIINAPDKLTAVRFPA